MGVDAECSHARRPATRIPVSSKPATGAPAIRPAITGNTLAMIPSAVRLTQPATVPAATGAPNKSLSAAAVRDTDRNCPCSRYTPIPANLGPYTIDATASGGAAGVGRAVNEAVVIAFSGIWAFNYVFTQTLLATHPEILVIR